MRATQPRGAGQRRAASQTDPLLTIPAVAERLSCSRDHVYNLIATEQLRATNIALRDARKTKLRVATSALAEFQNGARL